MKKIMMLVAAVAILGSACGSGGTTTVTVDEEGNVVAIDGSPIPVEPDEGIGDGADPLPEPEPQPEPEPEPEVIENWDYSKTIVDNTVDLVGKPVDDAFLDTIDEFNLYLGVGGYSVDERYWASYVAAEEINCPVLYDLWDQGVREGWYVYQAERNFNDTLEAAVEFLRTDVIGFGSMSQDEREHIVAAAYFAGGCEQVYFDFEEFIYGTNSYS